jgi:6-phosphofructokinase 1
MNPRRIMVMTSGGDAPGMNAAVRAVVRTAAYHGIEVFGALRGYVGMVNDEYVPMGPRSVSNIIQRGGTVLMTARCEEFYTAEGRRRAADNLRGRHIQGCVLIGGDGTFTGAVELARIWDGGIIGVPGTIDNDLYGTEYTIGFDTAVNTALDAIDRIRDTADAHERTFVIEVMGRRAGFIAVAVGTGGGAEEILAPETPTDHDELAERLKANWQRGKRSNIIVTAEGDEGGGAQEVVKALKKRGLEARATILGHLQRGGSPTALDRIIATQMGAAAVEAMRQGRTGVMTGVVGGEVVEVPLEDTISKRKPLNQQLVALARMLAV